jgi:putative lipoprotein
MRRLLALSTLLAMLTPFLSPAAEITGTALYRERIAAPPGARFEAALLDVSRADAPAVEIGRVERPNAGNPPYAFAIPYDPAAIDPAARYAVRASLRRPDGALVFTTGRRAPVLTQGAGTTVEIVMVQAAGAPAAAPATDATLIGPRWALTEVAGATAEGTEAHLVFDADGRMAGSGGCNRLGASYVARGDGAFLAGEAFSTMMACPDLAMATERAVFAALSAARGWRIEGDRLTLSGPDGAVLAGFVATPAE